MFKFRNDKYSKFEYTIIALFIFFTISTLLITYFLNHYINISISLLQTNIQQRLYVESKVIQTFISSKDLEKLKEPKDMKKPIYENTILKLREYAEENDLMYIYFLRLVDDKFQYILDSDPDPETHSDLGDFEELYPDALKAYEGTPSYNSIGEYVENWAGIMSAFIPVLNDSGDVIAIIGIDIDDSEIVQRKNTATILTYSSGICIVFLAGLSYLLLVSYRKKIVAYNNASIAKSQFLSRMSHEIRTPMNAIIGFCRMASNSDDCEKKREYLNNINNSSEYLLQLINSILDISKIESGKMHLNLDKASLYEIMQNIKTMMDTQAKSKNQTFNLNIPENIPNYIYCDKTYLTQVIVNLTSNALKFTPENGKISIDISLLEKRDNYCNLQFVITDTGIGIEEKYIPNLFEPFEQGDGSITRKYGGTGLGLAISKLIIEMMNGKISVTSKQNEGSTFTFNVWIETITEEPSNIIQEDDETIDCSGMTFLVVEDNDINQLIIQNILEGFGATIEFANNGKEGLEKFIQSPNKYDIIFMDIQMPIMDGFEATKNIRSSGVPNSETIPIIAMTAEVFKEDIDKSISSGMNAHVGKPFKISKIVSAMKDCLKK